MRVDRFDYELPPERIATHPLADRASARLLVVDEGLSDAHVSDLPRFIAPGALLVLNDTRVLHARLLGSKAKTGGKVEVLLLRPLATSPAEGAACRLWRVLGRGLSPFRPGLALRFRERLVGEVVAQEGDGIWHVRLATSDGSSVDAAIEQHGEVPLPPYLRRRPSPEDAERYQTVYARVPGAVAAPTAGLHLTAPLLQALREAGVRIATLTLHVGLGTFRPVAVDDLDDHPMHEEHFTVDSRLAAEIDDARARRAPVVAVGTTVVRALEAAADPERAGRVRAIEGETRLLIQPGYHFRVVDALLTNFHLPRSTLLALVAAFMGRERMLEAYGKAIERGYRFYSYGDAMWIPTRAAALDAPISSAPLGAPTVDPSRATP